MHPYIFRKYNEIISGLTFSGPALEVGATSGGKTLLNLPALQNIEEKVGINIDGPYQFKDFIFHQADANNMDLFSDNYFGLVLCNAMLEHDKYFWKTISEIKRVVKPGGLVIIGTPGFAESSFQKFISRFKKHDWFRKINSIASLNFILSSTLTLELHGGSFGDFYRFSPATYREVFFKGFDNVEITQVMQPPRIIGLGYKSSQ